MSTLLSKYMKCPKNNNWDKDEGRGNMDYLEKKKEIWIQEYPRERVRIQKFVVRICEEVKLLRTNF